MKKSLLVACFSFFAAATMAQNIQNNPGSNHGNKFEALGTILPTPNEYRTASGAPGPKYWQQRADYDIRAELDEENLRLTGSETITYFNNSPDPLTYLWLQLDENQHSSVNNANYQNSTTMPEVFTDRGLARLEEGNTDNKLGHQITKVTDALGKPLKYTINKTMMRLELPAVLKPGQRFVFKIDWHYTITDRMSRGGRGGYELFPEDGNYLFTITQWYPRLCVYSDFQGWQHNQFTGRGEFALTFGNFKVQMTVPADHVVGSTGECQNYAQVLTPAQLGRWQKAQTSREPVEVVTLEEAKAAESKKSKAKKTWIYKADNVRDFAWTSSRKFVWDAVPQNVQGKKIMCMSYYGKEAYGLYRKFSSKAVAHTVKTYSDFTIPYPYPVAISVEASNGMEYPMICFNFGRTEKDGTYSEGTKNGMLGVIIHEVGHNFFPMIINSDERQWTWMDEGLNTFVEYLTEELWDNKFPSKRGPAYSITDYMKLPKDELEPIMTNSENIARFGPNAYAKPATGLNILRETVVGRELFDYAFKEYARRWAFKHPTPADLFRTMNDATGENLDWFWRGWFYSTDACDISLDSVKYARADTDAALPNGRSMTRRIEKPLVNDFEDISKVRNREDKKIQFYTDRDTAARDFYWRYARGLASVDTSTYSTTMQVPYEQLDAAGKQKFAGKHFYELSFSNKGGLVMPIIVEWTFKDGSKQVDRIPAQIWRANEKQVVKFFMKDKEVTAIRLDPMRETADIDESNNTWGQIPAPSRFRAYKQKLNAARGQSQGVNPMQRAK
ncbi:MAG: aminopeptidase [Sphingobacteriales bacterium SCN 48-20]|uniref:M1 family metallopeptidase n=1 Tax=Terrimonas ferruginea TaxID=249 RepID=UPI00086E288C|nr:M1 family metallopeptidase [Terrimonas ferruginea]MBN8781908.1 M1 family peptidase [Terrimonas ferruginea]ODT90508.1 MAG: aminopeptidase [Sphingobacteriales bacterium SCN 48-20]OJW45046.1 MAG: aminopeptidase [Sphingobacteriales bacterium 48-107]